MLGKKTRQGDVDCIRLAGAVSLQWAFFMDHWRDFDGFIQWRSGLLDRLRKKETAHFALQAGRFASQLEEEGRAKPQVETVGYIAHNLGAFEQPTRWTKREARRTERRAQRADVARLCAVLADTCVEGWLVLATWPRRRLRYEMTRDIVSEQVRELKLITPEERAYLAEAIEKRSVQAKAAETRPLGVFKSALETAGFESLLAEIDLAKTEAKRAKAAKRQTPVPLPPLEQGDREAIAAGIVSLLRFILLSDPGWADEETIHPRFRERVIKRSRQGWKTLGEEARSAFLRLLFAADSSDEMKSALEDVYPSDLKPGRGAHDVSNLDEMLIRELLERAIDLSLASEEENADPDYAATMLEDFAVQIEALTPQGTQAVCVVARSIIDSDERGYRADALTGNLDPELFPL